MTDLQVAKDIVAKLADALWSAQDWETVIECRRRTLRGLTDNQMVAVEKLIYANREKRASTASTASTGSALGLSQAEATESDGELVGELVEAVEGEGSSNETN